MVTNGKTLVDELKDRGIKRVKVGGFDVDGVLRGKYMSLDKLASALEGGFGFCDVIFGWDVADNLYDQASVTGWHRGFPDALAVLDPETLRDLPWEPGVATLIADFRDEEGGPHPACPRSLLKTMRDRAASLGLSATFSCEYEFFMFQESPDSMADKGYRDPRPLTPGMFGYSFVRTGQNRELMNDILDGMAALDIEVEGFHTETGPGVFEAAIKYDEVLAAADKAALFKVAMKQIAAEHGVMVTFMPKWNADLPGCSGHLHQSLWRDEANVFFADGKPSETMRHYIGGLVTLAPEITAMISPTINAYKRYVPGVWAPLTASWGIENRTSGVRVIGLDSPKTARVEFRQSASDINPYIAMAACLGAGLWGIQNAVSPPAAVEGDATEVGEPLPKTLGAAAELFSQSKRTRAIFGDAFVDHYALTRRWEQREYDKAVTDWEIRRYFEVI